MDRYQSNDRANDRANDRMQLSVTAIFAGVFATLSLIVFLSVLSAAVGLVGDEFNWALFLPLTLLIVVLPFLAGGWIASRISNLQSRYVQAFGVWSVVTVVMSAVIGSQASAFAGGVLKQFGVAAGANVGVDALFDQLRELRPSLVTKVELKEGKATTTLVFHDPGPMAKEVVQAAKKEVKEEAKELSKETASGSTTSAEDSDTLAAMQPRAHRAAATASWALLSALVISLVASVVGAKIPKSA